MGRAQVNLRPPRKAVIVVALLVVGSACGSGAAPATSSEATTSAALPPSSQSPSPSQVSRSCAGQAFVSMTESQRIGQLFILGLAADRLGASEIGAIRNQHIGSVWFTDTTYQGVQAVRSVALAVQRQATASATDGVRFFVAANQEGGVIQALQGPGFARIPSALEQGLLDPSTLTRDATVWGRQLVAAGINLDFAPVMDVVPPGYAAKNEPIGVLDREFGHDASVVGKHGAAFIRGMEAAGIATTAKHFPGLGRVQGNTDFSSDVVDPVTTANDPSLGSFRQAIAAGAPFVMVSLATYPRIDPRRLAVFSPVVMRRMLRKELGFKGVIMSDEIGSTVAVSDISPAYRAIAFLTAGGDMIVSKTVGPTIQMDEAIASRAAASPAFQRRVNDAALLVLEAKDASGLLPCSSP
jgi:beta-N-acetylhexosaminidase